MKKTTIKRIACFIILSATLVILFSFGFPKFGKITEAKCEHEKLHYDRYWVEATCTEGGYYYDHCNDCNTDLERHYTSSPLGHDWDYEKATCTHGQKCKRSGCNATVAALPHSYTVYVGTTAPTCENAGKNTYKCATCSSTKDDPIPATGHNYSKFLYNTSTCEGAGENVYACTNSGCLSSQARYAAPLGHKFEQRMPGEDVAPTCVKDGKEITKCIRCEKRQEKGIQATGKHSYTKLLSDSATCEQAGYKVYQCATCTSQKSYSSPATDHSWDFDKQTCEHGRTCSKCQKYEAPLAHKWNIAAANCTQDQVCAVCHTIGQTALGHLGKNPSATCLEANICSRCGIVLEKATGHKWNCDHATCTQAKQCTKCGHIEEKKKDHTWNRAVASCTEDKFCTVCKTTAQKATGHSPKNPGPTCTEDNICTTCQTVLEKATGHKWKDATCTEPQKCTKCGAIGEKAKDHTWTLTERVEPTASQEGSLKYTCSDCGAKKEEKIGRLTELTVSQSSLTFSKEAESRNVQLGNVKNPYYLKVTLSQSAIGWLHVVPQANGITFSVKVDANSGSSPRSGQITFTDTSNNRSVSVQVTQQFQLGVQVTFMPNGGAGYASPVVVTVLPGSPMKSYYPAPPHASSASLIFDGWYTSEKGGTKYSDVTPAPHSNIILYAHWVPKTYYIVYNGNGATSGSMSNTEAKYGYEVSLAPNQFRKTNYVLECWTTNPDGTGTRYEKDAHVKNLIDPAAENGTRVVLYAKWRFQKEVTVRFDVNGGSDPRKTMAGLTRKVICGEYYGELPDLPGEVRPPANMVFDGWETADHQFIDSRSIVKSEADHTLYARWRSGTYTVHFDPNGALNGEEFDLEYQYGESATLPECPFDKGAMFEGWGNKKANPDQSFRPGINADAPIMDESQKEIRLYAIWREHQADIVYKDGFTGEEIARVNKNQVGHRYTPIDGPQIDRLKFLGWSPNFGGILTKYQDRKSIYPAGEEAVIQYAKTQDVVTLYAVYEPEDPGKIPVIFHSDGGDEGIRVREYEKKPGEYSIVVSDPHKTGFDFVGWREAGNPFIVNSFTISKNTDYVLLTAFWEAVTISFELDYGHDGLTKTVEYWPGGELYTVPDADREDYDLLSWKGSDGQVYHPGDKIRVTENGFKFTAEWQRRKYKIRYSDRYTEEGLERSYYSDQKLDYTPCEIGGKRFCGWICLSGTDFGIIKPDSAISEFVDMNYSGEYCYELISSYEDESADDGRIMICYHKNGIDVTGTIPDADYIDRRSWDGSIKTSAADLSKPGCVFSGWAASPTGKAECKAGESFFYNLGTATNTAGVEESSRIVIILYAAWESEYVVTLNYNGHPSDPYGDNYRLNALPGAEIDLSRLDYKRLFGKPKGYVFAGWGTSKDKLEYSPTDHFIVPEENVILFAIWDAMEFEFQFRNSITDQTIATKKYKYNEQFRFSDLDIPEELYEEKGYIFTGWTRYSGGWFLDPDKETEFTVTKKMTFYSTYDKEEGVEGAFVIDYNDLDGSGGPGTVYYPPGTNDISNIRPTLDGYNFKGWCKLNPKKTHDLFPDYPSDEDCKITGKAGERIQLYALFERKTSISINTLKAKLESEYGVPFPEEELKSEDYRSTKWERLDDLTYYVIRTTRKDIFSDYKSTVLVMRYLNGKWELKAYGTDELPWERYSMDVLTAHTNVTGQTLEATFQMINTAAEIGIDFYCPVAGTMIKASHYITKAAEIIRDVRKYDDLRRCLPDSIPEEVVSALWDKGEGWAFTQVMEVLLGTEGLSDEAMESITDLACGLFNDTADALAREKAENADPYGDYDFAFSKFKQRVESQLFEEAAGENLYETIDTIYRNAFSDVTGN